MPAKFRHKTFKDALELYDYQKERSNPSQRRGVVRSVSGDIALVNIGGSRQTQPAYVSDDMPIKAGDDVILVPNSTRKKIRWVVSDVIDENQKGVIKPTKREYNELNPPSNVRFEAEAPGFVLMVWDPPIYYNPVFEIEKSPDGLDENASVVLRTRGSYAIIPSVSEIYTRIRTIAPDGQRSTWTDWESSESSSFTSSSGYIEYPFDYTDALFTVAEVENGVMARFIQIEITTAFDNDAELQLGDASTPELLIAGSETELGFVSQYDFTPLYRFTALSEIRGVLTNSPTVGEGRVLVHL